MIFKYDFERQKSISSKLTALIINPGVQALIIYRLSYLFYKNKVFKIFAWLLYRLNHFLNGIDIHPGAIIGKNVIFYHTTGIVIGGTAVIGDKVKFLHGVTLGAKSHEDNGTKRHPTIENECYIGCGATILGNITIGAHSKIGADALILSDVAPYSTITGLYSIPKKI